MNTGSNRSIPPHADQRRIRLQVIECGARELTLGEGDEQQTIPVIGPDGHVTVAALNVFVQVAKQHRREQEARDAAMAEPVETNPEAPAQLPSLDLVRPRIRKRASRGAHRPTVRTTTASANAPPPPDDEPRLGRIVPIAALIPAVLEDAFARARMRRGGAA